MTRQPRGCAMRSASRCARWQPGVPGEVVRGLLDAVQQAPRQGCGAWAIALRGRCGLDTAMPMRCMPRRGRPLAWFAVHEPPAGAAQSSFAAQAGEAPRVFWQPGLGARGLRCRHRASMRRSRPATVTRSTHGALNRAAAGDAQALFAALRRAQQPAAVAAWTMAWSRCCRSRRELFFDWGRRAHPDAPDEGHGRARRHAGAGRGAGTGHACLAQRSGPRT